MSLIALGVTGGIGAYKAVEVARGLQRLGHDVVAIMTPSATRFVGPLTFEAITRRRVVVDQFEVGANADIEHIAIASDIALLVVAPATANCIAKFANGIADDPLSTLYLATQAPVLMAPAMNTHMLEHPSVRRNLERLGADGVRFVDPGEGYLACGWTGKGRLAEPEAIVAAARGWLAGTRSLTGRSVLVAAGPTYEDLDPVRYLGNRSSGRMGYALAEVAARRGASVTLITGPCRIATPDGVQVVRVRSAAEMHEAVMARVDDVDAVIMAAAVADYRPTRGAETEKIVKGEGEMTLTLERTKDILSDLGRRRAGAARPVLVGFAAETANVVARGRDKLERKQVDLIVANDVSRSDVGFESESNAVTLISAAGDDELPRQQKLDVAAAILDRVESSLAEGPPSEPEDI